MCGEEPLAAPSGAVPILFAVPRDRRSSLPNTRFLLHQPLGGSQAIDIRVEVEEILKARERLNRLIFDRSVSTSNRRPK